MNIMEKFMAGDIVRDKRTRIKMVVDSICDSTTSLYNKGDYNCVYYDKELKKIITDTFDPEKLELLKRDNSTITPAIGQEVRLKSGSVKCFIDEIDNESISFYYDNGRINLIDVKILEYYGWKYRFQKFVSRLIRPSKLHKH